MTGYKALEEAVSILRKYGRERVRLLNQEREDLDILRYQLYVLRKRACRRLEGLGLAVRESWEMERGLAERGRATTMRGLKGIVSWMGRGTCMSRMLNGLSKSLREAGGGSGSRGLSWGRRGALRRLSRR
jgi:hypothetical protein